MAKGSEDILRGFAGYKRANYPEVRINCINPACNDSGSHLYFNLELGVGNCKKCNYSPNLAQLVSHSTNISLDEAYRLIGIGAASKPRAVEEPTFEYKELAYPKHFIPLEGPDDRHPPRLVKYMLGRGITWEKALNYKMGYCIAGEYMHRLIVPIFMFGKLVSWQARDITGMAERKYKNPTGSEFSRYLFNYDRARLYEEGVVVEGMFDSIAVGDNCMCTFGKKIGEEQKYLLLTSGIKRLSVMFDADATLEDIKYAKEMARFIPTRLVLLPQGVDPDEIDRGFLNQLFSWAPYSDEGGFDSYMMRIRLSGSLEEWMKISRKPILKS